MTTRADFPHAKEMPANHTTFILERTLSEEERQHLCQGHMPMEMEDRWFSYCEDGKLYIHRSWTGFCIFIVNLQGPGPLTVTCNQDPDQFNETDIDNCRQWADDLLSMFIDQE